MWRDGGVPSPRGLARAVQEVPLPPEATGRAARVPAALEAPGAPDAVLTLGPVRVRTSRDTT